MRSAHAVTIVIAILIAAPAAAAWGARGSYEPDTAADRTQDLMWSGADGDPNPAVRKVYLNGWIGNGNAGAWLSLNPNSAVAQTGILQAPLRAFAMLGIWKDCNLDGYVGLSDNVMLEYPATLAQTNICGTGSHFDGTTVREFLPIGPDANAGTPEDANPHNIADPDAIVWADFKRPGDRPDPTCPITPIPESLIASTGGMLRYADCATAWRVTRTATQVDGLTGNALGIGFDDAPYNRPDQSGSRLNMQNPYGRPSEAPIVTAFDCTSSTDVTDPTGELPTSVDDPTGLFGTIALTDEQGRYAHVNQPAPSTETDPTGTPSGTVGSLVDDGFDDCNTSGGSAEDVDLYTGFGTGAISPDRESTVVEGRRQIDLNMNFFEGGARGELGITGPRSISADPAGTGDAGLAPPTRTGGFWVGVESFLVSRNAWIAHDTGAPKPVSYFTFYATVGAATTTIAQTPPARGEYGSEWCDRSLDPSVNGGLVCDADKWVGTVRVGKTYQLRDIDCYDTSARGARDAGAHWGTVTNTQCEA